jgi:hypothetical protein
MSFSLGYTGYSRESCYQSESDWWVEVERLECQKLFIFPHREEATEYTVWMQNLTWHVATVNNSTCSECSREQASVDAEIFWVQIPTRYQWKFFFLLCKSP